MQRQSAQREAHESTQSFYITAQSSLADLKRHTLKHGDTFALLNRYGDIALESGSPEGLYHQDTRFFSGLRLAIEGRAPLLLSSTVQGNNATLDVDLTNSDLTNGDDVVLPKDTIHLSRMKFLWNAACYEAFSIRNFGEASRRIRITLDFDADFMDIFEVRGFARRKRSMVTARCCAADHVQFRYASLDGVARSTEVYFEPRPTKLEARSATFEVELRPKQRCTLAMTVHCCADGRVPERKLAAALRAARRARRAASHRAAAVDTSSAVANEILHRGVADITMLVTDTEYGPYPYAGVPWFSTPFGRDGLITALEMLWIYPGLARGVLRFLAATQATEEDPVKDAEPGKILHETRRGELARLGEVPFGRYYGSVDSTPLFVALAGLYWQHTADRDTLERIWPSVVAALGWIDSFGDADRDGFVEYCRRSDGGLVNQGWKDSGDAVFHQDGSLAEPPIALCEVQGYVYLARIAAGRMAAALGEHAIAARQRALAEQLRERFDEAFWDAELGTYVLALDGHKRPCRVSTSNAGQVLYSGIAPLERAARVARTLMSPDSFTGWGIRTLAAAERRFNPASYHDGSVWPHDNALIALGFARYGLAAEAARVTTGIFDAAAHMELRRLPELFCGTKRRRDKGPILYPVACSPQAWAAGAPFAMLQACLGLEIDAAAQLVRLNYPRMPDALEYVRVRNLCVGDARLDLLLRRREQDVAVNVLERSGAAEVVVRI